MKKHFSILIIFFSCPMISTAQQTTDPIALVQSESSSIFSRASFIPKLTLKDDIINISKPEEGIILGKKYFIEQSKKMDASQYLFFVRYIITHELAHQIQFRKYGKYMEQANCEQKRIFECQADVISGIMLGRLYDLKCDCGRNNDINNVENGLTYIYNQGNEEYSLALHPTPIQRRNAFRYGLGYIGSNKNRLVIEKPPAGFFTNTDSLKWSFEISKLIMHYPLAACQPVVCTDSQTDWEKGTDNPIVHFHEEFLNTGVKPVRINVLYTVSGVRAYNNRLYHDTITTHNPLSGDSKWESVIIQPGAKASLRGQLNWLSVSSKEFMPKFIYSSDEDALYNAEEIDATNSNVNVSDYCIENYASGPGEQPVLENSPLLFNIYLGKAVDNLSLDDWTNLEAGFGLNPTGKLLNYRSRLRFPFSVSNTVMLTTDANNKYFPNGFIKVSFYEGPDSIYAQEKFNMISKMLKDHFGSNQKWEESVSQDEIYQRDMKIFLEDKQIPISLILQNRAGNWFLNLDIFNRVKLRQRQGSNSSKLAPPDNLTHIDWVNTVLKSQQDSFKNIMGQQKSKTAASTGYELNLNLPNYIYSSALSINGRTGRREVRISLCYGGNSKEILHQYDTVRKEIIKNLANFAIPYTIENENITDSVTEFRIYLNGNSNKDKPDIRSYIIYPDADDTEKVYSIGLRLFYYSTKN